MAEPWYCPACGCEMHATTTPQAGGGVQAVIDGCHCGPHGATTVKPTTFTRTADCPDPADPLARTGVFGPPVN